MTPYLKAPTVAVAQKQSSHKERSTEIMFRDAGKMLCMLSVGFCGQFETDDSQTKTCKSILFPK